MRADVIVQTTQPGTIRIYIEQYHANYTQLY